MVDHVDVDVDGPINERLARYYHITPDHSEPSSGALEERLVRKLDRCALTQKQHRWEEEL